MKLPKAGEGNSHKPYLLGFYSKSIKPTVKKTNAKKMYIIGR